MPFLGNAICLTRARQVLGAGVSLMALVCAHAAAAQEARSGAEGGQSSAIPEVVVTARRVAESAQTVPVSALVLTPDKLQRHDIHGLESLSTIAPGLTMSAVGNTGLSRVVSRGVPGVVTYFNGAPTFLFGEALFFDITNFQSLKGPQGTLFGIATNGGAAVFEPNAPTDTFGGYVRGTAGDYGRLGIEGVVNVPLSDKVQVRIGGIINRREGYVEDVTSGIKHGTDNYETGRISIRFQPSDKLENTVMGQYYYSHGQRTPELPTIVNPAGLYATIFGPVWAQKMQQSIALGPYKFIGALTPHNPYYNARYWQVVNTTKFDVSDQITLKNIFSHSAAQEVAAFGDIIGGYNPYPGFGDGLPFGRGLRANGTEVIPYTPPGYSQATNEEFQVIGTFTRFKFVVGTFHAWTGNPDPLRPLCNANAGSIACGNTAGTRGSQPTFQLGLSGEGETHAGYGQGTYDMSDLIQGMEVTAGVRYTNDKVSFKDQVTLDPNTLLPIPALSGSQGPVTYNGWTYHFDVDYHLSSKVMVYLSHSKGVSKGGFNSLSSPASLQAYGPETLKEYEAGIKSQFYTGNLEWRANSTVYYGKFNNIQVLNQSVVNNRLSQATQNAAEARHYGTETSIEVALPDVFDLSANAAFNNIHYTKYLVQTSVTPPVFDNRKNQPFILAPKWAIDVEPRVYIPTPAGSDIGKISVYSDISWTSKVCNGARLAPWQTVATGDCVAPHYVVNLGAEWNNVMGRNGLDARVSVTNVGNDKYFESNAGLYYSLGFSEVGIRPPRMFSVSLKYAF